jgi:tRNA (guanine-N7-)-methyltransferase
MGKDKLRKFKEVDEFDHCVAPTFEEAMHDGLYLQNKWKSDFFKNDQPIVLELACGGGEYTVGLGEKYPDKNFIGVDIKGNRIWKGAKKSFQNGMKNIGFLRTRIDFIENCFGENEVDEIWITFPDPQPQKNRKRKRLTNPLFLNRYRKILKEDGWIRLKTDSDFFFEFTLEVISTFNLETKIVIKDVYNEYIPNHPDTPLAEELSIKTYYEQKWLEQGKTIKYVAFRPPVNEIPDAKNF